MSMERITTASALMKRLFPKATMTSEELVQQNPDLFVPYALSLLRRMGWVDFDHILQVWRTVQGDR